MNNHTKPENMSHQNFSIAYFSAERIISIYLKFQEFFMKFQEVSSDFHQYLKNCLSDLNEILELAN